MLKVGERQGILLWKTQLSTIFEIIKLKIAFKMFFFFVISSLTHAIEENVGNISENQ